MNASPTGVAGAHASLPAADSAWGKFVVIGMMYMAETFPSSFVNSLVPTIFRKHGLALDHLWVFSLPLIPYWVRWAWAPIIDAHGNERLGRRKSWFLPCTILAVLIYCSLAFVPIDQRFLWTLVVILFLKSMVTSTQEVAIDAYKIDNLKTEERGIGAGIVVVSEAVGHLLSIAGIAIVYERFGWQVAAVVAGVLMLIFLVPAFIRPEPPLPAATATRIASGERPSLLRFVRRPDSRIITPLLLLCGLYTGAIVPMIGPYLVDQGFTIGQVGRISGITLVAGTIGGSLFAIPLQKSLGAKRLFRWLVFSIGILSAPVVAISLAGYKPSQLLAAVVLLPPVLGVAVFHVTVMTLRMGFASKLQTGTDYAIGSGILRIGQTAAGAAAGFIAAASGWAGFFIALTLTGIVASFATLRVLDALESLVRERNLIESGISEPVA